MQVADALSACPPSSHRCRALAALLSAAFFACLTAAGCGSDPNGGVPFTRTDASIPDRIVVEAPPAEVEVRAETGDGAGDGDGAEVSEVGDAVSDAETATPTMVLVTINSPNDNAVVTPDKRLSDRRCHGHLPPGWAPTI